MRGMNRALIGVAAASGIAGGLAPARAQDSVAPTGGLPGDALDAYKTTSPSEQVNAYIVDLSPITSSWGNAYALAPLAKSSKANSALFFNHLVGAQAASADLTYGPFPRPSYLGWHVAGQGIADGVNTVPVDDGSGRYGTVVTTGLSYQFGAAFMEFGGGPDATLGSGDDEQNVIGSVTNFTFREPNRLYVTRVNALSNKLTSTIGNTATASLGLGSVDAGGNVHTLIDGFGVLAASRVTNHNYVRVRTLSRDPSKVNRFQQSGPNDAAATVRLIDTATSLTTPAGVPTSVAGRPVALGLAFNSNLQFEQAPGSAAATTTAFVPTATDRARGNVSYTTGNFGPVHNGANDTGTGAVLLRTDANTTTRAVTVWGVNIDGSADSALALTLPTAPGSLVDPTDGFDPGAAFGPLAGHEFTSYGSQVCFRGGNGQVALRVLPGGDLLAAAAVTPLGAAAQNPQPEPTYLAVARVNAGTHAVTWTIAAHSGDAAGSADGSSKAILGDFGADGRPGTGDAGEGDGVLDATPIGRIALFSQVYPGLDYGPAISSPAMDSAGNLYFIAAVELNTTTGTELTTALLRANYEPKLGGTGGYTLELLLRVGDVVAGRNSTRNYQVQFMGVADGDSVDSGSVWSGSILGPSQPGADLTALPGDTPMTLGTLLVRAKIVYDADNNGKFIDPSTQGGTGGDQAYNVVLALMPRIRVADFNRSGIVNSTDVSDMINAWFELRPESDWNANGVINSTDVSDFINDWFANQ
jgi:hypothetical protein